MISCLASAMVTCSAWRMRAGDRAVACRIDDLVLAGGEQQDRKVDAFEIARHQARRIERAAWRAQPTVGPPSERRGSAANQASVKR